MSVLSEPQFFNFIKREASDDEAVAAKPAIKNYLWVPYGTLRTPGPVRRRLARAAANALVEVSWAYANFPQLQGYR